MKLIEKEELKVVQMDILSALDKFCLSNGIRYSIAYGTLLGAVRHSGYIPWDDDIDICMLRTDYNKLINEFPNEYMGRYELACFEKNSNWHIPFAKIFDIRTSVENTATNIAEHGVNIDVFPIDNVPDSDAEWEKFHSRLMKLHRIKTIKGLKLNNFRSIPKFLYYSFIKLSLLPISRKDIIKKIIELAKSHSDQDTGYVFQCCAKSQETHPLYKSIFEDLVKYKFEDREYIGIKNHDAFLSNAYGDYMTIPPVEKRLYHTTTKYYWK